jgi:hypothetical protein
LPLRHTAEGRHAACQHGANAAIFDGRRLSPALLEKLKAHAWPKNFYS